MIKKIMAYAVIIILGTLGYLCIFRGISVGNINILSYKDLQAKKEEYNDEVQKYNVLVNSTFKKRMATLENAKKAYDESKKSYDEYKEINSYEELLEATRDREYTIEFLWVKLELYARNNDLVATFSLEDVASTEIPTDTSEINNADEETEKISGVKNISVALAGDYLAVKNYIYDILIDLDLKFSAEDIVITPYEGAGVLATFKIKNVTIIM